MNLKCLVLPGSFGALLRQHRIGTGLSQEGLAERSGLSVGAVQSLEQGQRRAPYQETVQALARALELPAAKVTELEEAAAHARLRRRTVPASLPVTLTSFVERSDVDELRALLQDRRLVTIAGSAGVGKTRVAIEVARRSSGAYDVIAFVDLLPVRDGALVPTHVAARLGAPDVISWLRGRRALLVIDNCEHVLAEAGSTVSQLLGAQSATVLTTSREPLGLSGEFTYRLPSMTPEAATELFAARVQDSAQEWRLDEARTRGVTAVCRELDHIPLAIELAASRVAALGLDGVRAHLAHGLRLSGGPDLPLRHRTMQAAINWSYDLLGAEERRIFRRLSVFAGAFTLDVALEVAADESESVDIPEQVTRLVQKSLLTATHLEAATQYRFLDSIRAFANRCLIESGEFDAVKGRLAARLDRRAAQLGENAPVFAVLAHRLDLDDVNATIRDRLAAGSEEDVQRAARLVCGYRRAWGASGRTQELGVIAPPLVERLNENTHPELVAGVLYALRWAVHPGRWFEFVPRAIKLFKRVNNAQLAAALQVELATEFLNRGDTVTTRNLVREATLVLDDPLVQRMPAARNIAAVGAHLNTQLGDLVAARWCLDRMYCEPGHPSVINELLLRGEIANTEGNVSEARDLILKARDAIESSNGGTDSTVVVFTNLARYELNRDSLDAAGAAIGTVIQVLIDGQWTGSFEWVIGNFWVAVTIGARLGCVDQAAQLFGCMEAAHARERGCLPSGPRADAYQRARTTLEELLPAESRRALTRVGAGSDVFDLLEEYGSCCSAAIDARAAV